MVVNVLVTKGMKVFLMIVARCALLPWLLRRFMTPMPPCNDGWQQDPLSE